MCRARIAHLLGVTLVLASVACQSRRPAEPATLIIHHAQVYTGDTARPTADAIAARGDRIVLVGSSDAALQLRGPATRVIDAGRATLVPGIQDSHGHFTILARACKSCSCAGPPVTNKSSRWCARAPERVQANGFRDAAGIRTTGR